MGYTLYWRRPERVFGHEEFAEVAALCKKVCAASKVPIFLEHDSNEPPVFTKDQIRFNGKGEDGHETFMVKRVDPEEFEFCKTERKAYDLCATACLVILRDKLKFEVHTDDRNLQSGKDIGLLPAENLIKETLEQ